jgi:cobalt-zinc-cadmium efflux system outer membrane protein
MDVRAVPRWIIALGLVLLAGCLYPVREKIESGVCDLAAQPIDVQPAEPPPSPATPLPSGERGEEPAAEAVRPAGRQVPAGTAEEPSATQARGASAGNPSVAPVEGSSGRSTEKPDVKMHENLSGVPDSPDQAGGSQPSALTVPAELLPGREPEPIYPKLPKGVKLTEELKRQHLQRLYPPLPPLGPNPTPLPGPEGRPMTLADLQKLALTYSPAIQQAMAEVEAARGAAYQAGLWPNPTVAFENDTIYTAGGPGYPGGWVEQLIKTGGKLQLARASATMRLRNAELALRRAQTDLMTHVRSGYFQVLVARENIRITKILAEFADRVYQVQLVQLLGHGGKAGLPGLVAPHEPMYLRALAMQTRGSLVQARNAYIRAWKQLAAVMGVPTMPLTELVGRVDMPVPVYDYDKVLALVLARHTDVLTAENSLLQARFDLQRAKVEPYPDVNVRVMVQRDYTSPTFAVSPSVAVSVPVPLWNRNQGGIQQAQANLVQMSEEPHRVRTALTATLAQAFEHYKSNRVLLAYYRDMILPDLVRVYNGVYQRYHRQEPPGPTKPEFNDVVVAQNNLAAAVTTYVATLGAMWQAVVDVTDLLQTNDLFQVNGGPAAMEHVAAIPDLEKLGPLPCRHPCSPLPGLSQQPPDGTWPPVAPGKAGSGIQAPAMPAKPAALPVPPPRPGG